MSIPLPPDARLSLVRLYVDRPHMHGYHHFLAVRAPRTARRRTARVRLLHLAQLVEIDMGAAAVALAPTEDISPRDLARRLRRRRAELKGKRIAGAFVSAIIARLEETDALVSPAQLDLERLIAARAS